MTLHGFSVPCAICGSSNYLSAARLCRRRPRSYRWGPRVPDYLWPTYKKNAVFHFLSCSASEESLETSTFPHRELAAGSVQATVLNESPSVNVSSNESSTIPVGVADEKLQSDEETSQEEEMQRVFLVDGFGLLYRSYYALVKTTMSSKDMFDTRAVYGFTNVLLSLLQKHVKGNPVIVVFEGQKGPGEVDHRTAEYPEYKSGRGPTPAGVIAAIPWVKRIVHALGLSTVEQNLYEADDVIGTLVRRAKLAGISSVIVSIDKDFRQLLDRDFVSILKPGSNSRPFEYVTEDTFRAHYSDLHPSRYVDILTLVGDAADSIKGVPGIGPRTAPKLIKHFGSLEGLLEAARSLEERNAALAKETGAKKKGKSDPVEKILPLRHAASLTFYEQRTLMMKNMVTIRDNVKLQTFSWNDFHRRHVNVDEVKEVSRLLEFTSTRLISRMLSSANDVARLLESSIGVQGDSFRADGKSLSLQSDGTPGPPAPDEKLNSAGTDGALLQSPSQYEIAVSDDMIEGAVNGASSAVGIGVVYSVARDNKSVLKGIAISTEAGRSVFVDCTERNELPVALVRMLNDPTVEKVGWFMKENVKALLSSFGLFLGGRLFDVRIAADLIHAGHRLSDTSFACTYLWEGALKRWLSDTNMKRLSIPQNVEDALAFSDLALQASQRLKEKLKLENLERVAQQVEFPLIPVLAEMEITGVPCIAKDLGVFEDDVKARLESVESSLRQVIPTADDPEGLFRPTSRDDVAKLLFETWQLPVKVKRSASGKFPANKKVLSMIAEDRSIASEQREFAKLMIEHREVSKILNTYTRSLINSIDSDGRIRTTFVQDASYSGRLSTSRPNLQSIPRRSRLGRKVRSTVVAADGFCILCADYSQIELRIIAALSGDAGLRAAFAGGADVHTAVAMRIFGVRDAAHVTPEQRARAKGASYGIPYGVSAGGLAGALGIGARDARALIAGFHAQFPGVRGFADGLVEEARRDGCARTLLGRRLALPLLRRGGPAERRAAARVAVNMPVQGTQADMIKLAMARIAARLRASRARSRLLLQLHDELVLEVADAECDAVHRLVAAEMQAALPLPGVPVVVDVAAGPSWLAAAPR